MAEDNSIWESTGWEDEDWETNLNEENVLIENEDYQDDDINNDNDEDSQWFADLMRYEEDENPEVEEKYNSFKSDPYLSSWIPSKPTPKTNITDNAKYAYNYLNQKGLPQHVSAGIVGNLMKESNVNPTTRDGDKRGGIGGIAQWDPERSQKLISFSQNMGADPKSLDTQLEFVLHEAQQRGDLDKTLQAKTPEEAAVTFGRNYERPNERLANWEERQANARGLLNKKQYGGVNNIPRFEGISNNSIKEYLSDNSDMDFSFEDNDDEDEDPGKAARAVGVVGGVIDGVNKGLDIRDKIKAFQQKIGSNLSKLASETIDLQSEIAGNQSNALSMRKFNERKNRKNYTTVKTNLNQPLIYT